MHPLFTIGYGGFAQDILVEVVHRERAVLVDVRFHPDSRCSEFSRKSLELALGTYRECPKEGSYIFAGRYLGNKNYKKGPIALADPEQGIQVVAEILERRPAMLMCVCKNHEGDATAPWRHTS